MNEEVEPHISERYNILSKMGRGAYGIVWKAQDRKTGQIIALKKVFDAFQNSTDAQRTYREVMYLQQLNGHENIIRLISIIRAHNNKDLYLVFDLMETDLHVVIRAKILKSLHKTFIMYQLFKALKFIHSAELVHRDLKPANMLINSDCLMKLADFGLARSVAPSDVGEPPIVSDYIATRWYRAPEILLGSQQYCKSVDMWSAGCILAETLLERVLFAGKSSMNQLELIFELLGPPTEQDIEDMNVSSAGEILSSIKTRKTKSISATFSGCPPEAVDLLRSLLVYSPKDRMTVCEVLTHPYFSRFHNEAEEISAPSKIEIPIEDSNKLSLKAYRDALYENISNHLKRTRCKSMSPPPAVEHKKIFSTDLFRKKTSINSVSNIKKPSSPAKFYEEASTTKMGMNARTSVASRHTRGVLMPLANSRSPGQESKVQHLFKPNVSLMGKILKKRPSEEKLVSRNNSLKKENKPLLMQKKNSQGKVMLMQKDVEPLEHLHRSQNLSQQKVSCFFKKKSDAGNLQKTFSKNAFTQLQSSKKIVASKIGTFFLDRN